MKLISGWLVRALFVGSIAVVPAASVFAQDLSVPSGALVSSVDDTSIVLDGDTIVATSPSGTPTVALAEGKSVKIDFCKTDRGSVAGEPESLAVDLELTAGDRPMESLSVNFTKIEYSTPPMREASKFDGKFLVARDLTREQRYVLDLERVTDSGFRVEAFSGGIFVASADVAGGTAPFGFERVPSVVTTESRAASGDDHRGQIEVTSFSWSATTSARLPNGQLVSLDRIVVYVPETAGLVTTLGTGALDATRVAAIGMTGVTVMGLTVE